jgi:RNA 3'-terminal phosphate cyclase
VTRHLLTNAWVVQKLADVSIGIEGEEGAPGIVHIKRGS